MRTGVICAVLFLAPVLVAADDKPAVEEISLKNLKVTFPMKPGGIKTPEVVTSAEQLAKSAALKDSADEIKKHVDFDKQKLVFVAWQGSSEDKFSITTKPADPKSPDAKFIVTFHIVPGKSVDLRKHMRLFVVPKDASLEAVGN
jgi:hypothetical protein